MIAIALLLYLVACLYFSDAPLSVNQIDFQRFSQMVFFVFSSCFFWGCKESFLFSFSRLMNNIVSIFIAFSLAALIVAGIGVSSLGISFVEISYLLSLVVLFFMVVFSSAKWKGRKTPWRIVGAVSVFLVLMYGVLGLSNILVFKEILNVGDVTPGFANIRLFSDIAVGLMPLVGLYVLARPKPSRYAYVLCFFGLVVWWWMLFLTESRAGVLSLFCAMVVAYWLFGRYAKFPVLIIFSPAVPALFGWLWLNPLRGFGGGGSRLNRDITSSSGRIDLWSDAFFYAVDRFPLGIGPMQFSGDGNLRSGSAHNLFLNTAAEWGFPLALFFIFILFIGFRYIYCRSKIMADEDKPVYACLVMASVGVVVNAQFSGSHIAPLSSLVFVLSVGLVFGFKGSEILEAPINYGNKKVGPLLLWAGVMFSSLYLFFASVELYWLSEESTEICFEMVGKKQYYPRFWSQGRLECMQMISPDHWLFWSWQN